MSREEYTTMDVEDYFNYMGMLAAEVSPALLMISTEIASFATRPMYDY